PASSNSTEILGLAANRLANTDPAAPPPMITTSYFMDPPAMLCLLSWDSSDGTDSPEGHVFWYEPLDVVGASRVRRCPGAQTGRSRARGPSIVGGIIPQKPAHRAHATRDQRPFLR